jgi:hypothetical protein
VLHPIEGVAGAPAEIRHVDGRTVKTVFPAAIDPIQPMMNLRSITHEAAPGVRITCLMEGDTFEMEDQRNWTDASYKTYVRPLALPWPYALKAGEKIDQSVTLTVEGPVPTPARDDTVRISIGGRVGEVPSLGTGLDPDDVDSTIQAAVTLRGLRLDYVICHYDPRRGHDVTTLQRQVATAKTLGVAPWLEAVITSVDKCESEIEVLGKAVAKLAQPFAIVLVSPAPDMKCTLPGSIWPPCPPLDAVYRAARTAFPNARLGGGMFSYFTELNRKRPPVDLLDVVSFTTSAMVHAGDDRSVMESLQSLPAIAASAAAIAGPRPFIVGPSAIGMRANPYGDKPKNNSDNIRQAMNWNDPRQRGLLGAAWDLGYFARFAYGGAKSVALGSLTGAFGARHAPAGYPQPWYDEQGGLFPLFHVLRGLAALSGQPLRGLAISRPSELLGIAAETNAGLEIWLANLTGRDLAVSLDIGDYDIACLDADSFLKASRDAGLLSKTMAGSDNNVTLQPYAVARFCVRA